MMYCLVSSAVWAVGATFIFGVIKVKVRQYAMLLIVVAAAGAVFVFAISRQHSSSQ